MKQTSQFIIWCMWASAAFGQISPGGVKNELHWYVTDADKLNASFISKKADNTIVLPVYNTSNIPGGLNNYPALAFSNTSHLQIPLSNVDLSNASYFTVYKPFNVSKENIIWHIRKDSITDLVLTTTRMADLTFYKYMNFIDVIPLDPKVNTYIQQRVKDSIAPASQNWIFGSKPLYPSLPITPFQGLIPEIIAYDRVLNWEEQIRVASYLALKYGITLSEPGASYLNSAGEKIWDGESYTKYHHNIAGFGRDDSSGLFQKNASSSNYPIDLLSIELKDSLFNNKFLLWGDNGLQLIIDDKIPGIPQLLKKKWMTVAYNFTGNIHTDITINTKEIDVALPPKPVYWLVLDRTGKGNFSLPSTEYVRMSELDSRGMAHFKGISFNKDNSGKDVFAVVVGQELLASAFITSPACSDPTSGNVQIKVWGGQSPFKLSVVKDGKKIISELNFNNVGPIYIPGLTAGKYLIEIIDDMQRRYTDEFYINSIDAPFLKSIASNYMLQEGYRLQINAADQMENGLKYEWTGPGNFLSFNPKVTLTRPGLYTLKCTKNGCTSIQDILVNTPPKNIFTNIKVYPNPSTGFFTVKISLDKPSIVFMDVYTEDGKLVLQRKLNGFANYSFSNELKANGIYFLLFQSGLSKATEKLIFKQ